MAGMCQVDAFEHERQLRQTERTRNNARIRLNGNPKRASFQALVVQAVAASVPEENFYSIPVAVEEHEQVAGQGALPDDG